MLDMYATGFAHRGVKNTPASTATGERWGEEKINSLQATFLRKPSLADPRTRAAYVYLSTGRSVREKDLQNENIRYFLESLEPEERRKLFYSLFSVDSPMVHYHVFKRVNDSLSIALRKEQPSFSDGYYFSLAIVSRSVYREMRKEVPTSASLLTMDLILIEETSSMPPRDLEELYSEMRDTAEAIKESMGRMIFYPKKISGSDGKEYWRVVDEPTFLAQAPNEVGDIPKFLRVYL